MHIYHNHSDALLVALLSEGDKKAFEAIYRRYASDLYGYARKNIAVKEDCEEIIQEIFESLWARHSKLTHVTALSAYLFRMVKYKVIRYFQHNAIKRKYAEHYLLFEAAYDSVSVAKSELSEIQAMIERSISELPERCQLAIKLRLVENLSNHDIAIRMSIKKRTVENYIVTALRHLRESYQDLYKAG